MLYIWELCEDCADVNEIDYEIDDAWTNIHGIHDNGPRDHGVWRLTLTAYWLLKRPICGHPLLDLMWNVCECQWIFHNVVRFHNVHWSRMYIVGAQFNVTRKKKQQCLIQYLFVSVYVCYSLVSSPQTNSPLACKFCTVCMEILNTTFNSQPNILEYIFFSERRREFNIPFELVSNKHT